MERIVFSASVISDLVVEASLLITYALNKQLANDSNIHFTKEPDFDYRFRCLKCQHTSKTREKYKLDDSFQLLHAKHNLPPQCDVTSIRNSFNFAFTTYRTMFRNNIILRMYPQFEDIYFLTANLSAHFSLPMQTQQNR